MPSKRLEEILRNMPPESRAAIEKMTPEVKGQAIQTGQGLEKQGVAEKSEYVENGRRAAQTRSSVPADQMPERRIDRAITEKETAKTTEPGKEPEKATPAKEPER